MAFYNIYKIIKDMLRTLFGRKFLKAIILILLITIALLIVDKTTVQASSGGSFTYIDTDETEINITYPEWLDNHKLFIFMSRVSSNSNYFIRISYTDENYSLYGSLSNSLAIYFNNNGTITSGTHYIYSFSGTLGNLKSNVENLSVNDFTSSNSSDYFTSPRLSTTPNYQCFNNVDIYNSAQSGSLLYPANIVYIKYPEIATSLTDLQTLNFDVLSIDAWDYSTQDLYLLCYDRNSGYTESLTTLYPVNEILLNQQSSYFMSEISADPTTNAIYWIPKDEIGFNWVVEGTYAFRFAIRTPIESEYSDWAYSYLTDYIAFTLDSSVTQATLDDLNNNTKEKTEEQRHNETINSINNIDDFLTDDTVDENEIQDNLDFNNSNEDITNTNSGFFSRLTTMVSDLVDYDLSEDETIEIGLPFTTQKIILHSNMLYNVLPQSLQLLFSMFWSYLFGMYLFRFVNKIYIAISTGKILDGFSSSGEVITNNML